MKKWKPSPPEAVMAFDRPTTSLPKAEPRKMFGYSFGFAKGFMFGWENSLT
jgi:hypothetical protein